MPRRHTGLAVGGAVQGYSTIIGSLSGALVGGLNQYFRIVAEAEYGLISETNTNHEDI